MSSAIPKPSFPSPRRRSSIGQAAQSNGITPAPDIDENPAPAPPAADAPVSTGTTVGRQTLRERSRPAAAKAPARSPATAAKRPVASRDILLSLPEDAKQRMVNTITWTQPHTGIGQQQKFIRKAIAELCERLERDFNSGNPFPEPATPEED